MFLESFILYSLKSYRFITKLFSLIVKNAFSVLDFYSLFFILYSLFFILPLVVFLLLLFLTFLVGVVMGFVFEWFLCFWIFRTDLKENFFHQVSFLKKPKNFLNTSLGSNVSHTLHPYMPIKITSQLTYTQLIKNHKIETLP